MADWSTDRQILSLSIGQVLSTTQQHAVNPPLAVSGNSPKNAAIKRQWLPMRPFGSGPCAKTMTHCEVEIACISKTLCWAARSGLAAAAVQATCALNYIISHRLWCSRVTHCTRHGWATTQKMGLEQGRLTWFERADPARPALPAWRFKSKKASAWTEHYEASHVLEARIRFNVRCQQHNTLPRASTNICGMRGLNARSDAWQAGKGQLWRESSPRSPRLGSWPTGLPADLKRAIAISGVTDTNPSPGKPNVETGPSLS